MNALPARRAPAAVLGALLALVSVRAPAQSSTVLAETLFQEAKRLMDAKRYGEACPKLAESQRLDPGTGTLILLAACHEREGKLASAWSEYTDAEAQSSQAGRIDRVKVAREGVARIVPLLSRVTVVVDARAKVPGLVVTLDGQELAEPMWGVAMPVDPGTHKLEARAPERQPFGVSFAIAGTKAQKTFELGPLEPAPAAVPRVTPSAATPAASVAPAPAPAPPPPSSPPPSRAPAYLVGGVGALSLGVGLYFGAQARRDNALANERCPRTACADEEGLSRSDSAGRSARLANLFVGAGLVGLGAGVYLWVRAGAKPESSAASIRVAPIVSPDRAGVAASAAV